MEWLQHVAIDHNQEYFLINNIIGMNKEKAGPDVYKEEESVGQNESSFVLLKNAGWLMLVFKNEVGGSWSSESPQEMQAMAQTKWKYS